jgi:glycosyltransferase involved in cell wall biosynthesis
LSAAGVPARPVRFRGGSDVAGVMGFAAALRADRPRLVHLHVGGRSRLWLIRALSSAKRIAHLHGAYAEDGAPVQLEPFVRGTDAAIATSRAVAAAAGGQVTVVYPGVEIPEPKTAPEHRGAVIGGVGRLEPVKGWAALLEAVAMLRTRHPELRVDLAGSGTCEKRLRALAERLGITGSVCFLDWQKDVVALHRRWQLMVQPSIHEGFGLAALEGMAAGLPVVASATGGLPELVDDGRTGFLVPLDDVGTLAERVSMLLDDDALRSRMGQAARDRAREHFTVAEMTAKTAAVYDRLLAG